MASIANMLQMLVWMQKDVEDGRRRVEGSERERVLNEGKWP